MKLLVVATLSAALLGGCSTVSMSPNPAMMDNGVLVGPNGMTLYTFDRDAAMVDKSVCNGPCAVNWPPMMASASDKASGDYSIITRDDGTRQWAYKKKPLYFWAKDTKAGDRTGDGVQNVWRLVRP